MTKYDEILTVEADTSHSRPKIVTFQNGQLLSNNEEHLQCASYIDTKTNKTFLTAATDRLVYSGQENFDNDLFHTLLAFRNKKTNKIRLVQVNTVSLNAQISTVNSVLDTTLNSSTLNVRDLNKQFGSKRSKRLTEQLEKMKMNVSNVEDELKEAVAEVDIKEEDLVISTVDENEVDYRPKINRNASNVKLVYDLKTILLQSELNSLTELATQVKEKHTIKEELTPFVLDCVNKLKDNNTNDIEKYQILLYIDATLKFFRMNSREVSKKKITINPYPDIIVNKVLKDFTVISDTSRLRPIIMREKAVNFIIVLALIALNYRVDLTSLPLSMNVGIKKILQISRILGAQSLSSKDPNTIILKLPLAPPVKESFKRKRK